MGGVLRPRRHSPSQRPRQLVLGAEFDPGAARVLEAGCGFAQWVAFLAAQGYEAYGLDYSAEPWSGRCERGRTCASFAVTSGICRSRTVFSTASSASVRSNMTSRGRLVRWPTCTASCARRNHVLHGSLHERLPAVRAMRLKDWIVCNPLIRRLMGRGPEIQFFEYVFTPAEYAAVLQEAGFEVQEVVPLSPYNLDAKSAVASAWPWSFTDVGPGS